MEDKERKRGRGAVVITLLLIPAIYYASFGVVEARKWIGSYLSDLKTTWTTKLIASDLEKKELVFDFQKTKSGSLSPISDNVTRDDLYRALYVTYHERETCKAALQTARDFLDYGEKEERAELERQIK